MCLCVCIKWIVVEEYCLWALLEFFCVCCYVASTLASSCGCRSTPLSRYAHALTFFAYTFYYYMIFRVQRHIEEKHNKGNLCCCTNLARVSYLESTRHDAHTEEQAVIE